MCTKYYVDKIGDRQKRWITDTNTYMNNGLNALELFLQKSKRTMIEKEIKLVIPKVVFEELSKFKWEGDEFQKRDVENALRLINANREIIIIEGENDRLDIDNAFADIIIHDTILKNMINSPQLLITRDNSLASDILGLNNLKSIYHQNVYVCKINDEGELVRKYGIQEECEAKRTIVEKEVLVEKEVPVIKKVYVEKSNKYQKILISVLSATGGLITGYFAHKNKREIGNIINQVGKRMLLAFN